MTYFLVLWDCLLQKAYYKALLISELYSIIFSNLNDVRSWRRVCSSALRLESSNNRNPGCCTELQTLPVIPEIPLGQSPEGTWNFMQSARRSQRPWLTICITGGNKLLLLLLLSWLENCLSQVGKGNCSKGQWKKRKLLKFKAYASGSRKFTRQVLNCTFLWSFKNASRLECEIREVSGGTCHVLSACAWLPSGTGLICNTVRNTSSTSEVWELGQLPGREGDMHCWVCSLLQSLAAVQSCLQLAGDEDFTDSRGWVALAGFASRCDGGGDTQRQTKSLKRSVCFHKMALSWELMEV